jgi:hypothetical protein
MTTEEMRLYMRQKRIDRKATGKCEECGSRPAIEDRIRCPVCTHRAHKRYLIRKKVAMESDCA